MAIINRFIVDLASLSWGKVIGLGIVVGGVYWITMFDDGRALQDQLSQAQQQASAAEKEIIATKDALMNADRFEREVRDTVDQFTHIVDFMPEKMNSSQMIAIVTEMCGKVGLKLIKIEPQPTTEKAEFYETTKISVVTEGSFSQVLNFLSALSRVPKLLTFDNLELKVAPENIDQETPHLVASGVLVGYRYMTPAVDKSANDKAGAANESANAPAEKK